MDLHALPLAKLNMVREAWRGVLTATKEAGLDDTASLDLAQAALRVLDDEYERRRQLVGA